MGRGLGLPGEGQKFQGACRRVQLHDEFLKYIRPNNAVRAGHNICAHNLNGEIFKQEVTNSYAACKRDVRFYGVTFTEPTERSRLVLHGIVQEQLAQEADRLGQLLLSEAAADAAGRTYP